MIEKNAKYYLTKLLLFVVTFITTTLAGSEWVTNKIIFYSPDYSWADFTAGFSYSIPFLLILGVHEFGHYFTAKYHKVEVTLPNFIPGWLGFIATPSFGTFGALIKIVGPIKSRKQYFDIGIAGPLAGFVVAVGVLWYGFATLPPQEYIYEIHPEYEQYGADYANYVYEDQELQSFSMGNTILFWLFEEYVADPERLPDHREMIHFPILLAGFLSLFFTALNLLPIGQLDGGHIIYGIFGTKKHKRIATVLFLLLAYTAGLGLITIQTPLESMIWMSILYVGFLFLCFKGLKLSQTNTLLVAVSVFALQYLTSMVVTDLSGFGGYFLFIFLLGRVIGVEHPRAADNTPLSLGRKILGWVALLIFVISFSPNPFVIG